MQKGIRALKKRIEELEEDHLEIRELAEDNFKYINNKFKRKN